jgi:hypothetical protein
MHKKILLFLLCLAFALLGCTAQPTAENPATKTPPTIALPTQASKTVTITGMFTTIWSQAGDGGALYTITDDQGQDTKLLMEDETAKPLGGPLALDRKRVTIVGEIISDSPRTVRVQSVQFANP